VFAAKVSENERIKVLFVPLHLIDPSKDLTEEVGRFVRDEGILIQNPLDPESPEANLLIIFDGLDELASQGKAAAETARAFVREVERTLERRNQQEVKLRVLLSGRELVVQENESEFRRPKQILNLLPYYVPIQKHENRLFHENEEYDDPKGLLNEDLRQRWWKTYGQLTGKNYEGIPKELRRQDLDEVTAQPLLNYLVALSFTRSKLDFRKDINLNSVYADLVGAVHQRGYEKHRPYGPIKHMRLEEFSRVLEEIGLAAWHGDGRTTTVKEIEAHCRSSGLGSLLDVFQEGAKAGVTRLLAAFFFRQYGHRVSGDPTFVFTHKSFGEYLTARRVIRAIERVIREVEKRRSDPDAGWDEREALKHWVQITGPSPTTSYLHAFLLNEVMLYPLSTLKTWQRGLTSLFSYMLQHGMPIEQLQIIGFKDSQFQARNSEESLLVALNSCARLTKEVSEIVHPESTTIGAWLRRIQGQRTGPESALALNCLSHLDLSKAVFHIADLYQANLSSSRMRGVLAQYCCFIRADLSYADLQGATMGEASFESATLRFANLRESRLRGANFERTNLSGANLNSSHLEEANFDGADLTDATFEDAQVHEEQLRQAKNGTTRTSRAAGSKSATTRKTGS
jgi:uncharacterized protein YjbI with pentapeptide repeats